jgi:hypothetical protein
MFKQKGLGDGEMRKALLVICIAMCGFAMPLAASAGSFNAQGQFIGTVSPEVTALLAQFPGGGPGLRAAIAVLLEGNPRLADDAVFAARSANRAQKLAIGLGIADAARYFAFCGAVPTETCRAAEAELRRALIYVDFDPVDLTETPSIAPTVPIFIPGIGSSNSCISPSSPNGC